MQTQRIKVKDLAPNRGQIPGLPSNPRQWTRTEIDKIAKSLKETPELFEARPIIVTPWEGKYIILGGNLRYEGCKANKDTDAPCIVIPEGTPVDKMKEIVVKDNGAFGAWDYDALANEWDDLPLVDWGVPAWNPENETETDTPDISPDDFGEDFALPDEEKSPFRQVSFQLPNEMAETLLLATKAAQYTDGFYDLVGDEEDKNSNGVAAYIIAKEWCDRNLADLTSVGYDDAKKAVEELRQYLRTSLEKSGKKAVDVDNLLGTAGMSGHYFGSSQWMFPTRAAYEKMRQIMPLPRDYYECKKVELRFNLLETLQEYKKNGTGERNNR